MLTNDSKKLLYALYQEYLARRNVHIPRSRATYFHSALSIHENFASELCLEDVEDSLRELGRNGFVKNCHGDNTILHCYLTDEAIALFESFPSKALSNVANFIVQISNVVLPLIVK